MNKKGAELALNTMIIIIILLLVVVVIVVMLVKSSGKWNTGTNCLSSGGKCVARANLNEVECDGQNHLSEADKSCEDGAGSGAQCCSIIDKS